MIFMCDPLHAYFRGRVHFMLEEQPGKASELEIHIELGQPY